MGTRPTLSLSRTERKTVPASGRMRAARRRYFASSARMAMTIALLSNVLFGSFGSFPGYTGESQ